MSLSLSKRLSAVAELVPQCETLADIGTDHGLLPAFLLSSGRASRAVCTDINPLPLSSAVVTFERLGLSSLADFRVGDGLGPLLPGEAGAVCIAGMGGETIADILSAGACKAPLFILQPMTRPEALRGYLAGAGFVILAWRLCLDRGKLYEILCAAPESLAPPGAAEPGLNPRPEHGGLFCRIGRRTEKTAALYPLYLKKTIARDKKKLLGLHGPERAALDGLISSAEKLLLSLENE